MSNYTERKILAMLPAPAGLMVHYYADTEGIEEEDWGKSPTRKEPVCCLALLEWTADDGVTRQHIEAMALRPDGVLTSALDMKTVAFVEFE